MASKQIITHFMHLIFVQPYEKKSSKQNNNGLTFSDFLEKKKKKHSASLGCQATLYPFPVGGRVEPESPPVR